MEQILWLASRQDPPERLHERFCQVVVNWCVALGYLSNVQPSVVAWSTLMAAATELDGVDEGELFMRLATLLEQRAHQDAA